jgi:threonine synthase
MSEVRCTNCRRAYPDEGAPYRCPVCGGHYDFDPFPPYDQVSVLKDRPGIWRYEAMLGLPPGSPEVSLGEGNTPLIWGLAHGQQAAFKLEFCNPTGSFKDRGSASLVSFLRSRGVTDVVEDSSGNAGASLAAYGARSGLRATVFTPESSSGPKQAQIKAYGAEITRVPGPRSSATEAVRKAAEQGMVFASHAYLPFNLPGYATLAYELYEQLGAAPGAVILPAGQGGLLLGVGRGFKALQQAGLIDRLPSLVGVQARACAPLWALFSYGLDGLNWVTEGTSAAEGVCVSYPVRGDEVLRMVEETEGIFVAVDEEQIGPARDELSRQGLYVEATSAIVWAAHAQLADQQELHSHGPVVMVLTGSGLKMGS